MAGTSAPTQGTSPKLKRAFLGVWTAVGVIALTGVAIYLLQILSLPVSILLWTAIFVFCLRGPVNALEKRGVNRTLGTAIAYVGMFVLLALIGFLLFSPIFGLNTQFTSLIESVPGYVNGVMAWGNDLYEKYAAYLGDEQMRSILLNVESSLGGWASSLAQVSASSLVNVGTGVGNGLMAIGFALVIAFWVLMALPMLGREVKRIAGARYEADMNFLHFTFTRVMGGYIKGTLLQCLIIGVACGILFTVVGVPNAAAIGGITGVLNIIPIIGPWLGGGAAAIMALFTSPLAALITLAGTIIIQQVVYTFISPKIMGDSVDIHPALTLFALTCGSAIGGAMSGILGALVGMLVSIPAVAVIKACFIYYFEKHTGREVVSEDGVFFQGSSEDKFGVLAAKRSHEPAEALRAEKAETLAQARADARVKAADGHGEPAAKAAATTVGQAASSGKGSTSDAPSAKDAGAPPPSAE